MNEYNKDIIENIKQNETRVNHICRLIEYNVAQEAMARDYYYELRDFIDDKYQYVIDEIIDDEINHSIKLMKLCEIYSGNAPSEYENLLKIKKKGEN